MKQTFISATELISSLGQRDLALFDCRFSLDDPDRGRREYTESHIPGAVYVDLNRDLSAPVIPGRTGRHPLPSPETLTQRFSEWGIDEKVQVVAYDNMHGAIAARLWWMLRWLGHDRAAVLDGGWSAWKHKDGPVSKRIPRLYRRAFKPRIRPERVMDAEQVLNGLEKRNLLIIDSRSPERYRGEEEPYDPVAGHIPSAQSAFHGDNVDADGLILPIPALRKRFQHILGDVPAGRSVFYCGSGVTACFNLLALRHAGFEDAVLYAGAWSDWITHPDYPIE